MTTEPQLKNQPSHHYATKETVAHLETSAWVRVKNFPCAIALIPAALATGRVEFSLSLPSEVEAGTATAHIWAAGEISAKTVDYPPAPITAVRAVSTNGSLTLEVVQ